jgi:hypothetical protein
MLMCLASLICWDFVIFPFLLDRMPDDLIEVSSAAEPSVYTTNFLYYYYSLKISYSAL